MSKVDLNLKSSSSYNKNDFYNFGTTSEIKNTYTSSQVEINDMNFSRINYERNMFNKPELAPQEHYAWARWQVSEDGLLGFLEQVISIPMYEIGKFILPKDLLDLFKAGEQEFSPPSLNSILKGWEGAYDGLKDYINSREKEKESNRPSLKPEKEETKDFLARFIETSWDFSSELSNGSADRSGDQGNNSQDDSNITGTTENDNKLGKMSRNSINNKVNLLGG
ncbi:MAG: hypothetical protein K1X72_19945 [Pyrinomonadaceae bacterium]|nr:hypothetical protein [Pyrinomonadaceae bacterium]